MKKFILLIAVFLVSIGMKAHQADVSTTMLVEKENGTWILQISSSLTAFQHEIRTQFSETPYKTPEEFQQMVLEHIKNQFHFEFNGGQEITLNNGVVSLGHETKVVFEVLGIPKDISSIVLQNKIFGNVHKSQSSLLLLKEGFTKDRFVLDDDNNHTISLTAAGTSFVQQDATEASLSSFEIVLIALVLLSIVFLVAKIVQGKKEDPLPPFTLKKVV